MKDHRKLLQDPALAIVRMGPLISIPALLEELDCEAEPVVKAAGFELSQFENPDTEIPFIKGSKLLERCVEETGCEHFGLLMGERADPSCLGVVGFMLRVAPDVTTALKSLLRHLDLHDEGGKVTLSSTNDTTMLGYRIQLPGVHAAAQILDLSMIVCCNIMRALCGEEWNPTSVHISRPSPQDKLPYKRLFRAPVHYSTAESILVFPTYWLHQKLPGTDPFLFDYLEHQAAELHLRQHLDLMEKLRQFLRNSLPNRSCNTAAAARHLGIHPRTLSRRLRDEGTSFRLELAAVRYEVARELLLGSKTSNAQIASVLGYADATAFNRSFKQWSGATPAKWRSSQTG